MDGVWGIGHCCLCGLHTCRRCTSPHLALYLSSCPLTHPTPSPPQSPPQENYSGDAQLVNSVYFDNDSLELYHGRLDKKPGAIAMRVRCVAPLPLPLPPGGRATEKRGSSEQPAAARSFQRQVLRLNDTR